MMSASRRFERRWPPPSRLKDEATSGLSCGRGSSWRDKKTSAISRIKWVCFRIIGAAVRHRGGFVHVFLCVEPPHFRPTLKAPPRGFAVSKKSSNFKDKVGLFSHFHISISMRQNDERRP